ncbi:hypothetical protein, partial [Lactobacillus gallinarum]|uniref:hypothetical protein n=1 Tax=Lactobacillus gallinarum TaxID=52242 RepID=UPI00195C348F
LNRLLYAFKIYHFYYKTLRKVKKNSPIIVQYPLIAQFRNSSNKIGFNYLLDKLVKNYKIIVIIHDINSLRGMDKNSDIQILKYASFIISHNKKMNEYLSKSGIKKEKIQNLKVFDYLISKDINTNHFSDKATICFAGNLAKSRFLYVLPKSIRKLKFNLYGPGLQKKLSDENYMGKFKADIIHLKLKGKYGLVWDGNTYKTCEGPIGNYLRYNNPHKLSMYIVANMPVIIWQEAAEAEFVKNNGIGILINDLDSLEEKLSLITEEDYNNMVQNVLKIKRKITSGYYLSFQLKEIEKKLAQIN